MDKLQSDFSKRITRGELLNFITYLREKKNVTIESRTETVRTSLFRVGTVDVGEIARRELELIKSADSSEAVYCELASRKAKGNCRWKTVDGFGYIFEEDLTEYLLSLGFSADEAEEMTTFIVTGRFKKSEWKKRPELSEEFILWAGSGVPLMQRNYLPNLFRLDYLEFCHAGTLSPDTSFTVTQAYTGGAYNVYGYLTSGLSKVAEGRIIIGYRDENQKVDREKLIVLAEMICRETGAQEVLLRNVKESMVTIIRQTEQTRESKESKE